MLEKFIKLILQKLYADYSDSPDHYKNISFDEYLQGQFSDLGESAYREITKVYNLDEVMEVMND